MGDRGPGVIEAVSATGSSEPARDGWFREALKDKGIRACIPGWTSRGKAVRYDKRRYRRRNRIEIMFGRLKDRRKVATRNDRCAKTLLSAVALAETVMLWLLLSMSLDPRVAHLSIQNLLDFLAPAVGV